MNEVRETLSRVVRHESIEGIPMLVLANKQDCPGALGVAEIKEIFNPLASALGSRESNVLPVCAINGYERVSFLRFTFP